MQKYFLIYYVENRHSSRFANNVIFRLIFNIHLQYNIFSQKQKKTQKNTKNTKTKTPTELF